MRVLVLGGTRFIGLAIVEELVDAGHEVTVVHRGETEPVDMPAVRHIHAPRATWRERAGELTAAGADAVIDCLAMSASDADATLGAIGPETHLVVLSSQDVYRAFSSLNAGLLTDAVPVDEESPLREDRHVARPGVADYSKRDVEDRCLAAGAIVLRVPATYGERDNQRREEFILRRVRARRRAIPIGPGGFLWTRGWVRDIARGARVAAERVDISGEAFNLGEAATWSVRLWAERILEAAESTAELLEVVEGAIPADMSLSSGRLNQHVLAGTAKARALLGYTDSDAMTALRASVGWHLAHPPADADGDFAADDAALLQPAPSRSPG